MLRPFPCFEDACAFPVGMHPVGHNVGEREESPAHGQKPVLRRGKCIHHASGRREYHRVSTPFPRESQFCSLWAALVFLSARGLWGWGCALRCHREPSPRTAGDVVASDEDLRRAGAMPLLSTWPYLFSQPLRFFIPRFRRHSHVCGVKIADVGFAPRSCDSRA